MKRLRHPDRPGLHLRLVFAGRVVLGPGKAELLAGIGQTGSIAASGRRMGMSYKRAWQLVLQMNTDFRAPLVAAAKGGAGGGGARLTELGQAMLAAYCRIEVRAAEGGVNELAAIEAALVESAPSSPLAGDSASLSDERNSA